MCRISRSQPLTRWTPPPLFPTTCFHSLHGLILEAKEQYEDADKCYKDLLEETQRCDKLAFKRRAAVAKARGHRGDAIKILEEYLTVFQVPTPPIHAGGGARFSCSFRFWQDFLCVFFFDSILCPRVLFWCFLNGRFIFLDTFSPPRSLWKANPVEKGMPSCHSLFCILVRKQHILSLHMLKALSNFSPTCDATHTHNADPPPVHCGRGYPPPVCLSRWMRTPSTSWLVSTWWTAITTRRPTASRR